MVGNPADALSRIRSPEKVELLLARAARIVNSEISDYEVFDVGFEDCNIKMTTTSGTYVVKVFSQWRPEEEIERNMEILDRVSESAISHPTLYRQSGNIRLFDADTANRFVIMDFVAGRSLLDEPTAPTLDDLKHVVTEMHKIVQLDFHPMYSYDSWALVNFPEMYARVQRHLTEEDRTMFTAIGNRFDQIDWRSLPHAFCHGDLTKANVLLDDGCAWVLDFSVANWYPRIVELAVVAANFSEGYEVQSLSERTALIADLYNEHTTLTPQEYELLPFVSLVAAGMEWLGALQERFEKANPSEEIDIWLELGRREVQRSLSLLER